jgi:antitoxin (DNA-binding transcriptional repressor) of toxin-antitoxin stability system
MNTTVEIQDARDRLPELVLMAVSGEGVVLTEAGVPVARLEAIPQPNSAPRIAGLHAGEPYWMSDDFNEPLPDEFWLGDS